TVGGTQELRVWRSPGTAAPGRALYAVACLAKPTPATVERIGDALRTATFDTRPGSDATDHPGKRQ
ncbi:MAG TPA: hypothetical protein VFH94_05635, partial [Streptomyces sp.]|nr:hypothetical protein [Streptomyces sp.]